MADEAPSVSKVGGKRPAPSLRYQNHQRRLAQPVRENGPREVYFVQAQSLRLIKIGRAHNAVERLADLQIGSPDKLVLLGVIVCERGGQLESELHRRFQRLWSHGEWFRATPGLLNYIAKHVKPALPRGERHVSAAEQEWDKALGLYRPTQSEE